MITVVALGLLWAAVGIVTLRFVVEAVRFVRPDEKPLTRISPISANSRDSRPVSLFRLNPDLFL